MSSLSLSRREFFLFFEVGSVLPLVPASPGAGFLAPLFLRVRTSFPPPPLGFFSPCFSRVLNTSVGFFFAPLLSSFFSLSLFSSNDFPLTFFSGCSPYARPAAALLILAIFFRKPGLLLLLVLSVASPSSLQLSFLLFRAPAGEFLGSRA